MQSTTSAAPQDIEVLKQSYLKRLVSQLVLLRRLQQSFEAYDILPIDIQQFHRLAHNFSGSGGTFGFPDISHAARNLYTALSAYIENDRAKGSSSMAHEAVNNAACAFIHLCEHRIAQEIVGGATEQTLTPVNATDRQRIGVLAGAGQFVADLTQALHRSGYRVITMHDVEMTRAAVECGTIDIVILCSDLTDADMQKFAGIALHEKNLLPLIVISKKDDPFTRANADRLGARSLFAAGTDIAALAGAIERRIKQVMATRQQ